METRSLNRILVSKANQAGKEDNAVREEFMQYFNNLENIYYKTYKQNCFEQSKIH